MFLNDWGNAAQCFKHSSHPSAAAFAPTDVLDDPEIYPQPAHDLEMLVKMFYAISSPTHLKFPALLAKNIAEIRQVWEAALAVQPWPAMLQAARACNYDGLIAEIKNFIILPIHKASTVIVPSASIAHPPPTAPAVGAPIVPAVGKKPAAAAVAKNSATAKQPAKNSATAKQPAKNSAHAKRP